MERETPAWWSTDSLLGPVTSISRTPSRTYCVPTEALWTQTWHTWAGGLPGATDAYSSGQNARVSERPESRGCSRNRVRACTWPSREKGVSFQQGEDKGAASASRERGPHLGGAALRVGSPCGPCRFLTQTWTVQ